LLELPGRNLYRRAMKSIPSEQPIKVAALYRFCRLDEPQALRDRLAPFCCGQGIKGTLLLAAEGINGTVAGTPAAIDALLALLRAVPALEGISVKLSGAREMPFKRLKVRLKPEIVTMGVEGIDPLASAGTYVEPADWNALIADPATLVIDTRNDYEVKLGTFQDAVDPGTRSFREFPAWLEKNREAMAGRKVAMFCTGGIRCEKATAYAKSAGIADVFHLKGGILAYLEAVPAGESLWQGECFVFDERVSLAHGLEEGQVELCRACRMPVTQAGRASPLYRLGISCDQCHDRLSDADRARFAERQRQIELADRRAAAKRLAKDGASL